jgi:hypothetical protein
MMIMMLINEATTIRMICPYGRSRNLSFTKKIRKDPPKSAPTNAASVLNKKLCEKL